MDIDTARAAGPLAAQRDAIAALLERIDAAIAASAPILIIEGAETEGGGGRINLLPFGPASAEISALVWQTARDTYVAMLAVIDAQLAAL